MNNNSKKWSANQKHIKDETRVRSKEFKKEKKELGT